MDLCFAPALTDVDGEWSFKLIRVIMPQPVSAGSVLI